MTARAYASPEAFKQALEQRLRTGAQTGPRLRRSRQLLVFERFLARISAVFGDAATLKGGLALELRIKRARATKDETHIAEKLHAYTMPRARPNTRVKDLPDLALLATAQPISAQRLRSALEQTFAFRNTHSLPAQLPQPLTLWTTPYAAMARENQLAWLTLPDVTEAARQFLDPVLAAELDATWEPQHWRWELR